MGGGSWKVKQLEVISGLDNIENIENIELNINRTFIYFWIDDN